MSTKAYDLMKHDISDTFDSLKHQALDAVATRKVTRMHFTIDFKVGEPPKVTSKIFDYGATARKENT